VARTSIEHVTAEELDAKLRPLLDELGKLKGRVTVLETPPPIKPGLQLVPSGPITTSSPGQIIERRWIRVENGVGVDVRHTDVVIRDCWIDHRGSGDGIQGMGATGLKLYDVRVHKQDAPERGPLTNPSSGLAVRSSPDVHLDRVLISDFTTGISATRSPRLLAEQVLVRDPRGGAAVSLEASDEYKIERSYLFSDRDRAWNNSVFISRDSSRGFLLDTLINGCNAPSGRCVVITTTEQGSSEGCQVIGCDALGWSAGAFFVGGNVTGALFLRCRARDSYRPCGAGRGEPPSNSLLYAVLPSASGVQVEEGQHFNLVNPDNLFWDRARLLAEQSEEVDFVPLAPLELAGGVFDL
jgi:hypothetical protein